jgi:hypothetical protein
MKAIRAWQTLLLLGEQLAQRRLVMVLELFRLEMAGLLRDDVLGDIEHVLGDLHVLDVIEILRRIAHLVRVAQQHAHQTFVTRFQRDDVLAVGQPLLDFSQALLQALKLQSNLRLHGSL